jgi:hypothetical protein
MWLWFSAFLLKAFVNRVILRLLAPQYQLLIDLGDLLRADPEARWSSWRRRAASLLSPNDVGIEEGWPASNDPMADSTEPPAAGSTTISAHSISTDTEAAQRKWPSAKPGTG